MATSNAVTAITLIAGADLSANQFRFVDVNSSGQTVRTSAAGQRIVGVQLDKAGEITSAAGEASEVAIMGVVKIVAGAAFAAGVEVKSDDEGRAISAATEVNNHYAAGIALEAATAAGQVISVLMRIYRQAA